MDLAKMVNVEPVKFGLKAHQIEMIKQVLTKFEQIQEVWIYGSRARGDFGRSSDIDLCIKDAIDFSVYLSVLTELDELFIPFKFDLVRFDKLDNPKLKANILLDGQIFYRR